MQYTARKVAALTPDFCGVAHMDYSNFAAARALPVRLSVEAHTQAVERMQAFWRMHCFLQKSAGAS